jgi:putative serine protease PepD
MWGGLVVAAMIGSGVGGGLVALQVAGDRIVTVPAVTVTSSGSSSSAASGASTSLAAAAALARRSVVAITVEAAGGTAEGSGVILSSDGYVLTNDHVVSAAAGGSGALTVTLPGGKQASATVIGRNAAADLAVIKIDGVSGLTAATLGRSSSLEVGDTVLAVGSPLGLTETVTSGIVSALDRTIQVSDGSGARSRFGGSAQTVTLKGAIQTDTAINPGNSGGALVDVHGAVVGITAANASVNGTSGSIGVGFAIPIDTAATVARDLIAAAR